MSRSLKRKLDALREHLQVSTHADALIAMLGVIEEAVSSERAFKALHAPSLAPAFRLPGEHDRPVSLIDRLADGPVLLVFYPGDWCPKCMQELEALQATAGQVTQLGASLGRVTSDSDAQSSLRSAAKTEVSDPARLVWPRGSQVRPELGDFSECAQAAPRFECGPDQVQR